MKETSIQTNNLVKIKKYKIIQSILQSRKSEMQKKIGNVKKFKFKKEDNKYFKIISDWIKNFHSFLETLILALLLRFFVTFFRIFAQFSSFLTYF